MNSDMSKLLSHLHNILNEKPTLKGDLITKDSLIKFDEVKDVNKVYAVDGGCSLILDGGSWLSGLIKIGYVIYKGINMVDSRVYSYLVNVIFKGKDILFEFIGDSSFSPDKKQQDLIKTYLIKGYEEEILSKIMKFSEWNLINSLVDKVEKEDIILVDGNFSLDTFLGNIVKETLSKAKLKGKLIVGISKTSRLSLDSGRSLIGYLFQISKDINSRWYFKYNDGDFIVKFHPLSKYVYRVQIDHLLNPFIEKFDKLRNIFGRISFYSKDASLLGYPYPLLKVDYISRITKDEKDKHFNSFYLNSNLDIRNDLKSMYFHNELDMRRYR